VSAPVEATQAAAVVSADNPETTGKSFDGVPSVAVKFVTKPAVHNSSEPRRVSATTLPIAETSSPRKPPQQTTPDQLWAQVKKNKSDAEIELARMYLEGVSVPRNCTQARILLEAASRHGNALAIDLLKDRTSACH
jgi:TPR repeat protein